MRLESMRWPQVRDLEMDRVVFVVPLGSYEQHGPHLPVSTDAELAAAIATRIEAALPDTVVMLPALWIGHSPHHRHFPGTISLHARPYVEVLKAIAHSLVDVGARRICYLNCHGGNTMPAQLALRDLKTELGDRRDLLIALANFWEFTTELWQQLKEDGRVITYGHAGDIETSMVMAVQPTWVKHEDGRPDGAGNDAAFDWQARRLRFPVHLAYDMRDVTSTGVMGDPGPATVAKGEAILETAAAGLIAFLQDFQTWDPSPSLATPMARPSDA